MKMSQLLGMRFKETPADCQTANHILMIRGGYIKQVSSGVFSLFMPMRRVTKKVEAIIRDEMDKLDGQELETLKKTYARRAGDRFPLKTQLEYGETWAEKRDQDGAFLI